MFSFFFTDAIFEMGAQGIFLSRVCVSTHDSFLQTTCGLMSKYCEHQIKGHELCICFELNCGLWDWLDNLWVFVHSSFSIQNSLMRMKHCLGTIRALYTLWINDYLYHLIGKVYVHLTNERTDFSHWKI